MVASSFKQGHKPVNRLTPYFGNQPLPDVQPVAPAVTPVIADLAAQVQPRLPCPSQGWFRDSDHTDLFRAFPQRLAEAEQGVAELHQFLLAIVKCGTQAQGTTLPKDFEVGQLRQLVPTSTPPPPGQVGSLAELAAQPDVARVHRGLDQLLHGVVATGLEYFFQVLKQLHEREVVGRIEWLTPSVARFFFYRLTVRETTSAQVTSRYTARTQTRVWYQAIHYHEILKAVCRDPRDGGVPLPAGPRRLLKATPRFLAPQIGLVTGQEIFRRVLEREIARDERTQITMHRYHPDPCIILGDYVLAGWGLEEV